MSPQLVGIFAAIAASQARVEAMKVTNAGLDLQAYPPTYGEDAFFHEAAHLDMLSTDARNCQS